MDRLSSNPYGKAMSTETSQAAQIRQWHYEWHPGKDLRAEAEVGRGGAGKSRFTEEKGLQMEGQKRLSSQLKEETC